MNEKDPLLELAGLLGLRDRVEPKLSLRVKLAREIQQDGRALMDGEVVCGFVDEHGDAAVRVDLEVPVLLLLIGAVGSVHLERAVIVVDGARVRQLQLLEEERRATAIRCLASPEE